MKKLPILPTPTELLLLHEESKLTFKQTWPQDKVSPHDAMVTISMHSPNQEVVVESFKMSNDLPTDNIGEAVTQVIQKAWGKGDKPPNMTAIITFS